jgi:exopolysaccharide biosynthesis polyprenyl glycosylphosphotransferase
MDELMTTPTEPQAAPRAAVDVPGAGASSVGPSPWLAFVDALVLVATMAGVNVVRFAFEWPTYSVAYYFVAFVLAALVHVVVFYFDGLYEPELRLGNRPHLPRVAKATLVALLLIALVELLTARYVIPRGSLPILLVLETLAVAGNRRFARSVRLRREGPPRVVVVGAATEVTLALQHLARVAKTLHVVGHTDTPRNLLEVVDRYEATDVLLLSVGMLDQMFPEPLSTLERRGVGVLQRVTAKETLLGLQNVREVGGMPFVALGTHTLPLPRVRLKRCLELAGVAALLPLIVPLVAATALYVRFVAGSPVLYRQLRIGRDGHLFTLLKFRTMRPDAEIERGPVLAEERDPRVIPGCDWVRRTRLDELPQLWNVLRGEMSVVGPRPERPEIARLYESRIPGYARRHELRPGITGLAQVHGRYHTDAQYKLGHDLHYLVNWSPVLDLQVLLRTVWVVLTRRV